MDLNDTPVQAEYRAKVRRWLEENAQFSPPENSADAEDELAAVAEHRAWQARLAAGGLIGITWPKEAGGEGLGPMEAVIAAQELDEAGVAGPLGSIGVTMIGPTIIAHGTPEQQQRYLPPMQTGEEIWCELFSEPAAGSDLAGIESKAVLQDDGTWRISGQKVWTTQAHYAELGMILARTDPTVPKHAGLTMFIVNMKSPGILARPLVKLSGHADFNEVFFDDVVLPADSVLGGVGNGWGTALTTLMFERLSISQAHFVRPEQMIKAIADLDGASRDPGIRRAFGEASTELLAVRFHNNRLLSGLQQGRIPGPEAGLAKITATAAAMRMLELAIDASGPGGLNNRRYWGGIANIPTIRIAGGSDEILRNTIGERTLGLPGEPRLDKGIPFSELRALKAAGRAPVGVGK